jgi:hypothetical protein
VGGPKQKSKIARRTVLECTRTQAITNQLNTMRQQGKSFTEITAALKKTAEHYAAKEAQNPPNKRQKTEELMAAAATSISEAPDTYTTFGAGFTIGASSRTQQPVHAYPPATSSNGAPDTYAAYGAGYSTGYNYRAPQPYTQFPPHGGYNWTQFPICRRECDAQTGRCAYEVLPNMHCRFLHWQRGKCAPPPGHQPTGAPGSLDFPATATARRPGTPRA